MCYREEELRVEKDSQFRLVGSDFLKKSIDFEQVYTKGRAVKVENWLVIAYLQTSSGTCRIGTTISSKVGNAVLRNKLKRWVRTYHRKDSSDLKFKSIDFNFIFKPNKQIYKELDYKQFSVCVSKAVEKIKRNVFGEVH